MDFPALFNNIFAVNILGMWENKRGFTPPPPTTTTTIQGYSSLLSQYHNTDVWTFLKPIMKEHIKMMQIPYLDIWSMLLFGQIFHRSNSSHLFWNLKDPVLVQTLSYRRKITYHLLLIGFFQKLISMQDVGHMLHLHVAQQLPSLYLHQWIISPTIDNDAELNRQFPFDIDLNKILPELLKLRTKAEKPAIQFSQHTYVNGKRKNSLETRVVMLISLLELEISGVAVQSIIHQNSKKKTNLVRNCSVKMTLTLF